MTRVVIAIVTYQRPASLATLLEALATPIRAVLDETQVEVVVVDNDAEGSARSVVSQAQTRDRFPLRYTIELTPGIAAARNRALALSSGARFLAFIDDDELPSPDWLGALLRGIMMAEAPIVTGPVEFHVPDGASPGLTAWIEASQRSLPDLGDDLWPATSNVLLDLDHLPALEFDNRYGLSGGSDLRLFQELRKNGYVAKHVRRATVSSTIPDDRATLRWNARRQFRLGNTQVRVDRDLDPGFRTEVVGFAKAGVWMARGLVAIASGVVARDSARRVAGLMNLARGTGRFAGLIGYEFIEYRRSD